MADPTAPPTHASGVLPRLPGVLNGSRRAELDRVWEEIAGNNGGFLDGSTVHAVDSEGLAFLLQGLDGLRRRHVHVVVQQPSDCLMTARRALRLQDRIPVRQEDEEPPVQELSQRLGEVLIDLDYLDPMSLQEALQDASTRPDALLGTVLLEKGMVNEEQLAHALACQYGFPYVAPVGNQCLDVMISADLSVSDLRVHGVLPFLRFEDILAVAVRDPSDVFAADVVRRATGLMVVASVASAVEIERGLDLLQRAISNKGAAVVREEPKPIDASSVPVEERFQELLVNALIEGASDIHIEPLEEFYVVRCRVDGRLRKVGTVGDQDGQALTAHIKVRADCDISEKRVPQDGRIHFQDGIRDVDLRVNTMPTVYGEKTVMRILDRTRGSVPLDVLGLDGQNLAYLREGIHFPHGMVLVTGPTGSGKTTTLYSVLDEIVSPEINICTVENPVERAVDGVIQTQVNQKAGLDFGTCLRSLLRQDPDVIMIGEIRDQETAEIAVEAALTGHLVLATLHTNDAPGAATRLIQMGVEPFLVAATLRTVMAQRLIRRICESCKEPYTVPSEVLRQYLQHGLEPGPHFKATGCPVCRQVGYDKRQGVFEVMRVDPAVQDLIARNPSAYELREKALEKGMKPLIQDALRYVNKGQTTLEEALRAAGTA
ncbi:MAG: type II secretion system protein GspE [Planctomycetota bacterium]|nr:MAG: type II secretion system protein GspE [Planctomycetota bacterium]